MFKIEASARIHERLNPVSHLLVNCYNTIVLQQSHKDRKNNLTVSPIDSLGKGRVMRRVRYCVHALLLAVALFASLMVPAGIANAASDYDGTITTTNEVHIASPSYSCSVKDLTLLWSDIMLDSSKYNAAWGQYLGGATAAAVATDFSAAQDNELGWAVSQGNYSLGSSNGGGGAIFDNTVNIQFSPSDTAYVDFGTIGAHTYAYMRTTDSDYVYNVRLSFYKPTTGPDAGKCLSVVNQTARWTGDKTITWINSNYGGQNFSIATDWVDTDSGFVTDARPLFIHADTAFPPDYEGVLIPTVPPRARYVAMGDSFSSGEGVSPFEAGTDTGSNSCHRSPKAYPRLLENDPGLSLGSTAFVACSGATTQNVLYGGSAEGAWGESPQINALSLDTEVVTITIGGNDVGFKGFATACTIGSCDFATTAYSDIHGKITNDLPGELAAVYEAIDGATSSTAKIYVVGYPQIAPAEMPTGPNSACYPLNGGTDNPDPELNDGATAYAVVSQLNSAIEDAVTAMGSKFHFVDPNLPGSPFIGHDWCQQDRYFIQIGVPIPPSNTEYSFHPNTDGQEAYATVVGGEID